MVGSLRIQLLFEHCHMATRSFLTTHSYPQGHRINNGYEQTNILRETWEVTVSSEILPIMNTVVRRQPYPYKTGRGIKER